MRSGSGPTAAVLFDLLMAVMDSLAVWTAAAAGDRGRGLAWRDAVTRRMRAAGRYVAYETVVTAGAWEAGLGPEAVAELMRRWSTMDPWPDAASVTRLRVPYAFVTNCSVALGAEAAARSRLTPAFVLSAEEAGWYKPRPEIYRLACERIGAAPAETLFVAGSPYDADGARDAGLRVLLVRRRADLERPAGIPTVGSLSEAIDALDPGGGAAVPW